MTPAGREYGRLLNLFHYKELASHVRDLDRLFGTTLTAEGRGFESSADGSADSEPAGFRDLDKDHSSTYCRLLAFPAPLESNAHDIRGTRPGPVRVVFFRVSKVCITSVNLHTEEFCVEFWLNFIAPTPYQSLSSLLGGSLAPNDPWRGSHLDPCWVKYGGIFPTSDTVPKTEVPALLDTFFGVSLG